MAVPSWSSLLLVAGVASSSLGPRPLSPVAAEPCSEFTSPLASCHAPPSVNSPACAHSHAAFTALSATPPLEKRQGMSTDIPVVVFFQNSRHDTVPCLSAARCHALWSSKITGMSVDLTNVGDSASEKTKKKENTCAEYNTSLSLNTFKHKMKTRF